MFREFPKRGSSPLLGFNSSNDWNSGMERLEPTLVFNGLNGAHPSTKLRARPEFYRRNERMIEPVMVSLPNH